MANTNQNNIEQHDSSGAGDITGRQGPRMYSYEWMKAEDDRFQLEKRSREEAWRNTHPFKKVGFYTILATILFVIIYVLSDPFSSNNTAIDCTDATREVQTIVKVDGKVDTIETETINGCETSNGDFYSPEGMILKN